MKTKMYFAVIPLMLFVFSVSSALAGGHGKDRPVKKGILLVAFGTSVPEAQKAFGNIGKKTEAAYPGVPVRWAYTSSIIRKKLAKQGQHLDSPEVALAKMMDEEYTHVAVQSLHTIGGEEFHHLRRNAHAFTGMAEGFQRLFVGDPLLSKQEDLDRVVDGMIKHIPKDRKKEDAVVLMGHGSEHPANAFYAALMYHFQRKDPNIFVGTVEGGPLIGEIREQLLEKKIKKTYLMPFMSVAGDHAMNDMAGDEDDSWKTVLTGAGIKCIPVLKGTAEYDEIIDIWIDHLGVAMTHLK